MRFCVAGSAGLLTPHFDRPSNLQRLAFARDLWFSLVRTSSGLWRGVAMSGAIFTGLSGHAEGGRWLEGVITFQGRQDNLAVRESAIVALSFNLLMVGAAIISIMLTIPKGKKVD